MKFIPKSAVIHVFISIHSNKPLQV